MKVRRVLCVMKWLLAVRGVNAYAMCAFVTQPRLTWINTRLALIPRMQSYQAYVEFHRTKGCIRESQLQDSRRIDMVWAGSEPGARCVRRCADRRQVGASEMGRGFRASARRTDSRRPDQPTERAAADRSQEAGQGHRRAR